LITFFLHEISINFKNIPTTINKILRFPVCPDSKQATGRHLPLMIKLYINKNIFLFLMIFCLVISSNLYSQNITKEDSLRELLSHQLNDSNKIVLLGQLSDWLYAKEDFIKAIHYQLKKTQLLQKNENDALHASDNEKLALMYYQIGNYKLSSTYFLKALRYFENTNNEKMTAQIMGNLANIYTRIDNYKSALEYLYKSKNTFEKKEFFHPKTLAATYINIGLAYTGLLELDSALLFYNKTLLLIDKTDEPRYYATVLNNMGEVYFELKEYDKALSNYQKSFELFCQIENFNGMGASKLNIAKIKIQQEKFTEAIALSNEGLTIIKKINVLSFIVIAHKQLHEAYKGLNNYKMAHYHLEKYLSNKDLLKSNEKTEYIANLKMQYDAEKEHQKLKLLEQEKQIKEQELAIKENRFYVVVISISALLLITILIIFYLRSNLQKNKLKQQLYQQKQEKLQLSLNYKQGEVEAFANYLKEKNLLLETLKIELRNTQLTDDGDIIKQLTGIINQHLHIDKDRKKLELKINQKHQEFVKRLHDNYPQLTSNDIRLCSLILLDLNNKEIATILNIEPSSVKMNKNRLRKKLLLSNEKSLKTSLSSEIFSNSAL